MFATSLTMSGIELPGQLARVQGQRPLAGLGQSPGEVEGKRPQSQKQNCNRSLDITILGCNDFYSYRNQLQWGRFWIDYRHLVNLRMMSDYAVEPINDGISEFNVEFHGSKESNVSSLSILGWQLKGTSLLVGGREPPTRLLIRMAQASLHGRFRLDWVANPQQSLLYFLNPLSLGFSSACCSIEALQANYYNSNEAAIRIVLRYSTPTKLPSIPSRAAAAGQTSRAMVALASTAAAQTSKDSRRAEKRPQTVDPTAELVAELNIEQPAVASTPTPPWKPQLKHRGKEIPVNASVKGSKEHLLAFDLTVTTLTTVYR
ncbi:hypothetical protein TEA_001209 [Camellia sinensis var. sinensis]|uniref:Uncharacterized protein n=1 Tax=Camellia sinensis var. sinensis TaxID=542762 RepID=A0A4S4EPZ1_CAMSN|nr:hypothetical protein TEA_001209 [Camellia sinensis var. sinensis]